MQNAIKGYAIDVFARGRGCWEQLVLIDSTACNFAALECMQVAHAVAKTLIQDCGISRTEVFVRRVAAGPVLA